MKLNKLIPLSILSIILSSCGVGPSTITGITSTLYIDSDSEQGKLLIEPVEYIKEDKKQYPRYEVMNSRIYSIVISPTWRGSRMPVFVGNVATFTVSPYWKIEYDEDGSATKRSIYNITFDYPVDTEIEDLTLNYSVGEYTNHMIIKLIPYHTIA